MKITSSQSLLDQVTHICQVLQQPRDPVKNCRVKTPCDVMECKINVAQVSWQREELVSEVD